MLCVQGEVKPALARLAESRAARARELSEELLSVQERLDAGLEALTERTEENATLGTQVSNTVNSSNRQCVHTRRYCMQPLPELLIGTTRQDRCPGHWNEQHWLGTLRTCPH